MHRTLLADAALACALGASASAGWAQAGTEPPPDPIRQISPGPATGAVIDKTARGSPAGSAVNVRDNGAGSKRPARRARYPAASDAHR